MIARNAPIFHNAKQVVKCKVIFSVYVKNESKKYLLKYKQ